MGLTQKFIQNLQRFRLVTFDITDTLLSFRKSPGEQYCETAAKHGYPHLNPDKLMQVFRIEFKLHMKKYPNYGHSIPNMDWRQWWTQLVLNVFNSMESGIPEKDALVIAKELVKIYRTEKGWIILDGAHEIVNSIKDTGKKLGVISNTDSSLPLILQATNFNKFDFIITANDCGILKPSKKIFDLALARCNVESNQALHIGNLYDLDYVGARNAGWSSILISKMTEAEMRNKKGLNKNHVFQSLPRFLDALQHKVIDW